jgi:hypothetical protein
VSRNGFFALDAAHFSTELMNGNWICPCHVRNELERRLKLEDVKVLDRMILNFWEFYDNFEVKC